MLPDPSLPAEELPAPLLTHSHRPAERWRALFEVVLCSGYVTQLTIIGVLGVLGLAPATAEGAVTARFIFLVSALDTVLLLSLIFLLMAWSGDRPADVFLGRRPIGPEAAVGLGTVPVVFAVVMLLQVVIQLAAPFLRNVPQNPFASMLGSPLMLAGFILLTVIAGGLREELQRAFLLTRFEQHLGGARLGLLITSLAFGLGHTLQGWDAAVVTGLLGAFWGTVYLWRRSAVATFVSHACFNAGQVVVGYLTLT